MGKETWAAFWAVLIGMLCSFPGRGEGGEAAPQVYGRACLTVQEENLERGGLPEIKVFDQTSTAGPGRKLVLYADSEAEGYVFAAAFRSEDHALARDWRPQMAELRPGEAVALPAEGAGWNWETGAGPFELMVVFLAKDAAEGASWATLVGAMQDPAADPKLLELQAGKLREQMLGLMGTPDPSVFHAGSAPSAWGGTLRGFSFPWRQMAEKVPLREGRGVLVYTHGA